MQDVPELQQNMELTQSEIEEQDVASATAAEPSTGPKPSRRWRWNLIQVYKEWLQAHPGTVSTLDFWLFLPTWFPTRTADSHNQWKFEVYHALAGLFLVWHHHVIDEVQSPIQRPAAALWLDLVEQLEVLIEVRAMHLEHHGRLNRYGPLTALEVCKSLLKMCMWVQYPGHLFLRHPGPDDLDQFDSEQGLEDVLAALERLRLRYAASTSPSGSRQWNPLGWFSRSGKHTSLCQAGTKTAHKVLGSRTVACGVGGMVRHVSAEAHMGINLMWTAELLHIWRPVLYVAMLKRYGRQSWRPWTTSLLADLLSMYFTHRGKALMQAPAATSTAQQGPAALERSRSSAAGGWPAGLPASLQPSRPQSSLLSLALARRLSQPSWSAGEGRELDRRCRKLLMYLMRSPALDLLLRPMVERLRRGTARIPVVSWLADYFTEILDMCTAFYTYTSGSSVGAW